MAAKMRSLHQLTPQARSCTRNKCLHFNDQGLPTEPQAFLIAQRGRPAEEMQQSIIFLLKKHAGCPLTRSTCQALFYAPFFFLSLHYIILQAEPSI